MIKRTVSIAAFLLVILGVVIIRAKANPKVSQLGESDRYVYAGGHNDYVLVNDYALVTANDQRDHVREPVGLDLVGTNGTLAFVGGNELHSLVNVNDERGFVVVYTQRVSDNRHAVYNRLGDLSHQLKVFSL